MFQDICPVTWVASTFKNSFWGETLQLLSMSIEICLYFCVASIFKNSFIPSYSRSQCVKSFASNADLQRHLRVHSGEKPYIGSQCSKSFNQSSGLQLHLRIHAGEKPYSCEKCTKSFARSDQLKRHVKSGVCRKSAEFIGHMNAWWIPMMYRNYFAAFYFITYLACRTYE